MEIKLSLQTIIINMKKIILINILISLAILACNSRNNKNRSNQKSIIDTNKNDTNILHNEIVDSIKKCLSNELLKKYDTYLNSLDSTSVVSNTSAFKYFQDVFKNIENKDICDTAYHLYNCFRKKLCNNIDNAFIKDSVKMKYFNKYFESKPNVYGYQSAVNKSKLTNDTYKKYYENLFLNGFQITFELTSNEQGYCTRPMITIFYDTLKIKSFISSNLYKYIMEYQIEEENPYDIDASLAIKPLDLAKRLIWWENFINSVDENFIYYNESKWTYKVYLFYMMFGMCNTPCFYFRDDKTLFYDTAFANSHKFIICIFPNSVTAKYLKPLYKALNDKNEKIADEIGKKYLKEKIIVKPY